MINQRKAGVILSYLNIGLNSIIMLVYVPMLLYYLTKEQYGIYQLMGSLIAYLSIMDFGLANTTTRYLSQAYENKNSDYIANIINTSHTIYLCITGILLCCGGVFYFLIGPVYSGTLPYEDLSVAKQIYLIMLFNIVITIPSNIFKAAINAREDFIFLRGINLIRIIIQPFVIWGILAWKAYVINLVLVQTFFNLFVIALNYLYCKIKLKLKFNIDFKNKVLIKELSGFSVFIFLHAVMDQVYWRLGPLILGAFSGAVAVANYAIALQILSFSLSLPATLGDIFLPKLSAIVAKTKDLSEINNIFCKMGRLQYMVIMLLLIGFAFLGKTFIVLWVGAGYEVCYYIAVTLISAYVIDVSQNIGIPILQAMKKHAFRAYVYLAMAVLNVVLCIPLAKYYGEIGCAAATAICLFLGSGLAINWYYSHVGLDMKRFFYNLFSISKGIVLSIVLILLMFYLYPAKNSWFSLFLHGVVLVGIYCATIWFIALNQYEKNLFLNPLKQVCKKVIKI